MGSPEEMYSKGFSEVEGIVKKELGKHGNAKSAAYAAIAKDYDLNKMSDKDEVMKCLKDVVKKYRQKLNMLPDDKNMTAEMKQDIEDHILVEMERWGLSISDIAKMFKNGKGADVVDQITRIYRQQDVRRKHDSWYAKKVHLPGKHADFAKGHKAYHKDEDDVGIIQAELKDRIYSKLEQKLDGLR